MLGLTTSAWSQQSPYAPISGGAAAIVRLKTGSEAPVAAAIGGTAPISPYRPLSWHGITIYGTVDIGAGYMSHGQALGETFGRNYLVSKSSGGSRWGVAPNALGSSSAGIRIKELLHPGIAFVLDAQTTYLPTSGRLSNGLASLISNTGVPQARQSGNGDSSRANQIFNSFAFAGIDTRYGTLTYGRQNSFTLDGVTAYDPVVGSNAFSLIGAQGLVSGTGTPEAARLDSALRYLVNIGPLRTGLLHQFDDAPGKAAKDGHGGGGATQFDLGATLGRFSGDAIFSRINDAISAYSLNATQARLSPSDSLGATVSDNTSVMLLAKYRVGRILLMTGYEDIRYDNPTNPVIVGSYVHGYRLAIVNNAAYVRNRLVQVAWVGARYTITKKVSVYGGYYHEIQNSYAANRCADASLPSCSGTLDAISVVADYRLVKHFEFYGGTMLSTVVDGLSSGYHNRSNIDPTIGGRFTF